MKIIPLGNRLLVRLIKRQNTSASGVIISTNEAPQQTIGEVIATGKGFDTKDQINVNSLELNVGDIVSFGRYVGVDIEDNSYNEHIERVIDAKDIIAKIIL